MIRVICTLTLLLSLMTWVYAQPVHMPDPNLRAAVRDTLCATLCKLPDRTPVTRDAMLQLIRLDATDRGVANLTGLEFATNLRWLSIARNPITDLSPIAGLIKLETLYMWATPVSDITPVANLTNLINFRPSYCEIADISPLANLFKLRKLSLNGNEITDITPLANLTRLELLNLSSNHIVDVSPLANLTQLRDLTLHNNRIADVRPLAGLTLLTLLSIENNRITDHSPLDGLSLERFTHDTFGCDMPPLPLAPRIENRNFPSLFTAWSDKARWPSFDLIFCCPRFDSRLVETDDGFQFRTGHPSWDEPVRIRDAYLDQNSTMVFLHGISVIWYHLEDLPEDSPWWLRDENGEIQLQWGRGLMNLNHPGWQQRVIEIAAAIDQCGLYDGLFIDGWSEWHNERRGQLPGQIAILRGIREQVRDDLLIMVNTNDNQAPASAPYINGLFMETVFPKRENSPQGIESRLSKIEDTLKWAEHALREPRITGLEGRHYDDEPLDSPKHMQWMRAITTLSLTFSNGYAAFPLRGGPWYDFWNADLGRPVGDTLQLYDNRNGLYIREFTKGWAVYNHSGAAQVVRLPEEVQGVASGLVNVEHALPNLDGEMYLKVTVRNPADVNRDGVVNILDLTLVAQAFGGDQQGADVNGDGVVNVFDLVFVANAF